MTIHLNKKLQKLLAMWPSGEIMTTKWLARMSISRFLLYQYKKQGWLQVFGHGAFKKPRDKIEWYGALSALQHQLNLKVHVGAKTALELTGVAHYIRMGHAMVDFLKYPKTKVPKWFTNYPWKDRLRLIECSILPSSIGLEDKTFGEITIRISCRERALLELLYLAPRFYSFDEVPLLIESLRSLRGDILNELLMQCSSEKVKRLVLYFGEKQNHAWYNDIDQTRLSIGKTILKIAPNSGKYIAKYGIFIPKDYVIENDQEVPF
jgi:hypothetical protein